MAITNRRTQITPTLAVILALTLAACASGTAPSEGQDPPPSQSPRAVRSTVPAETAPPEPTRAVGEVPEEIVEAILADAEDRTEVPAGELVVLIAEMVTWPDGALGCPEPGMMYTQALVDGYQVVVDADGAQLDYRVGEQGGFRLCEDGGRPAGS